MELYLMFKALDKKVIDLLENVQNQIREVIIFIIN